MMEHPFNAKVTEQLLSFPCFADAKKMKRTANETLAVIHAAYDDENLNEAQDLAFECVLHFNEYIDHFDLRRALSVWSASDVKAFEKLIQDYHTSFSKK